MRKTETARYPIKNGPRSSHSQVIKLIGTTRGGTLLDVGCSRGDLMVSAMKHGWEPTGIEPYLDDAQIAIDKGLLVYPTTVENALKSLEDGFDVVLLADVLEHLPEPQDTLRSLKNRLKPNGRIIASIPNIAHWSARILLLIGRFDYTETGILDKTHLRFFTKKTVKKLFDSSGMSITRLMVTPIPLERLFPNSSFIQNSMFPHLLNQWITNSWPSLLGYQFLVEARINEADI